jgi:poly-gamma-glutamate capsule biosynthesis protein CapA/YwtB (metallophosphatase superfamily)
LAHTASVRVSWGENLAIDQGTISWPSYSGMFLADRGRTRWEAVRTMQTGMSGCWLPGINLRRRARVDHVAIGRRTLLTMMAGATLTPTSATPTVAAAGARRGTQVRGDDALTLFLCGDVMLGREIDQILAHPNDPRIYEPEMSSAIGYVELAEKAHGPIPRLVDPSYVWGDAIEILRRADPDLRIINLETSITRNNRALLKGINYRMNPENISTLTAAEIDCCSLANNHVLDWGREGLIETLDTLAQVGVQGAGAGSTAAKASAPAILELLPRRGRVLVFAFGSATSGIPSDWAATETRSGVNFLRDLSSATVARIAAEIHTRCPKRERDCFVASIHWGSNWGYDIPMEWRHFAYGLIDEAGFDVIHGHSSHHTKGIELYRQKLILYGCGDFLNDYEGIGGYEHFRDDLVVMYLPTLSVSGGRLRALTMIPLQIRKFRLTRATTEDTGCLYRTLARESAMLGTHLTLSEDQHIVLAPE